MKHGDLMIFAAPPVRAPSAEAMRAAVFQAEDMIKSGAGKIKQVDLSQWPVFHHFARGLYGREWHMPANHYFTGHIHKFDQLNILSRGECTVLTPNGPKLVRAGFHIVSPAGTKRIAKSHTDCIWTTIHGTDLRDVEAIEAFFIAHSEQEYVTFLEQQKLLAHAAELMEV